MRSFAWARFALLAGVVLLMGASCSFATRRTVTTDTNWKTYLIPGEPDSLNAAETFCENGRPVIRVKREMQDPDSIRAIWEHERVHIEDLQADPNKTCDENAQEQWGSPPRYAFAEARAYCSQLRYEYYQTSRKGDFLLALMRAAKVVAADINDEQGVWKIEEDVSPEVAALFIRVCPFVTVVEPRR